jgi:hypothetical protein
MPAYEGAMGTQDKTVKLTEILGALAVVISLIFVGVQINENTRATKSAMASAMVDTSSAWYVELGNSEEASSVLFFFLTDPDSLTDAQRFQATMNLHGLFLVFQNSFYLVEEGTLETEVLHSLTQVVDGVKEQPGLLLYWKQRRYTFSEQFQNYVDSILASSTKAPSRLFRTIDNE